MPAILREQAKEQIAREPECRRDPQHDDPSRNENEDQLPFVVAARGSRLGQPAEQQARQRERHPRHRVRQRRQPVTDRHDRYVTVTESKTCEFVGRHCLTLVVVELVERPGDDGDRRVRSNIVGHDHV